jgi:hypothetical protein
LKEKSLEIVNVEESNLPFRFELLLRNDTSLTYPHVSTLIMSFGERKLFMSGFFSTEIKTKGELDKHIRKLKGYEDLYRLNYGSNTNCFNPVFGIS